MLKRYLPHIAIAIGLVGLLITGAVYVMSGSGPYPAVSQATPLPRTLAGLALKDASYGPDAVAEVTRMHGKAFAIQSGARGNYGTDQAATLWVAQAPDAATAAGMVTAMRDRIAAGTSPFTPLGTQDLSNRTVYTLEGMGQQHFYFQSGVLVIWLAAGPALAQTALRETLTFYP